MSISHSAMSGGIIGIFFSIFLNMMVCCVFSLESPHRGDSNEYTQHTNISREEKIILNIIIFAAIWILSKGLKNKFETVVVNKPSVFEPLKFFCICIN